MANYVTNIVRFKGDENRIDELRASVQDERYGITGIDFDKIIPMPKNLFMGAIGPMERELYGKNNWLDWSLANWGSKWNSMPTEDPDEEYEPGTLRFLTANNPPHPVLQKLSEMYPDITMEHQWADDNIGMGCGQRTYQAGKIIDEYCPDYGRRAIEFACEVTGQTPADRGLVSLLKICGLSPRSIPSTGTAPIRTSYAPLPTLWESVSAGTLVMPISMA